MTEKEAIELLRSMQNPKQDYADVVCAPAFCTGFRFVYPEPEDYAIEEATKALKEIQQYREIGSVKECKEMASIVKKSERSELANIIDEWIEYRKIGTVEECREAVEKQKPMKVNEVHVDEYYCPACGSENCCDQGKVYDKYCPVCGRAIYQEESEEE